MTQPAVDDDAPAASRLHPEYSGWVVVSFWPGPGAPTTLPELRAALGVPAGVPARRLIRTVDLEQVRCWQRLEPCALEGSGDCGWPWFGEVALAETWRLFTADHPRLGRRLVRTVRTDPHVRASWRERSAAPATVSWRDEPDSASQPQLGTERGVGATALWASQQLGSDGAGVGLVAVECGWELPHVELPSAQRAPMLSGSSMELSSPTPTPHTVRWVRRHGTNALGVLLAADNGRFGVGLAPGIERVALASAWQPGTAQPARTASGRAPVDNVHVADAILAGLRHSDPGDLILVELQRGAGRPLPTEIDLADRTAIQVATRWGRVVVEPAGNGARSLDAWHDPTRIRTPSGSVVRAGRIFAPGADHRDSGAILVGATRWDEASAPPGHVRHGLSNHGLRVDCCALGQGVTTTGAFVGDRAGVDAPDSHTPHFGHTSAATAIVAGAIAAMQGVHLARHGVPNTAGSLRLQLRSPALTTRLRIPGAVGGVPDLARLLPPPTPATRQRLGRVPITRHPTSPAQTGWGTGNIVAPPSEGGAHLGRVFSGIRLHDPTRPVRNPSDPIGDTWIEEWIAPAPGLSYRGSMEVRYPDDASGGFAAVLAAAPDFPDGHDPTDLAALMPPLPGPYAILRVGDFDYSERVPDTPLGPSTTQRWAVFELHQPYPDPGSAELQVGWMLRCVDAPAGAERWSDRWVFGGEFVLAQQDLPLRIQLHAADGVPAGPGSHLVGVVDCPPSLVWMQARFAAYTAEGRDPFTAQTQGTWRPL